MAQWRGRNFLNLGYLQVTDSLPEQGDMFHELQYVFFGGHTWENTLENTIERMYSLAPPTLGAVTITFNIFPSFAALGVAITSV